MRAVWIAVITVVFVACGGTDGPGAGDGGMVPGADGGSNDEAVAACGDATVQAVPDDPAQRGPWPVGARTVDVDGLVTEVWYPAVIGSEQGAPAVSYDLREHLPPADQAKIPDEQNPLQVCDCYRDLPLDEGFGPYPVVVFVHGTAGFRTQTLTQMTHWASRGFVVVSSDHPGINLAAVLQFQFGGDQTGDAMRVLDQLETTGGDLSFLSGHIDMDHVGLAGHSAGGGAIEGFGSRDGVKILIPFASGGSTGGASLESTLVMGGEDDGVAPFSGQQNGFSGSNPMKRLVGLANAGHLAFSDLCYVGRADGGLLTIAQNNGIQVNPLISSLARDGCEAGQLEAERGWEIINFATSAALEETLHCDADMTETIATIQSVYAEVSTYQEEL